MSQKKSILDVAGVVDLPLSLLGKVFQRYLSLKHKGQLVKHGKTARAAKFVLYKIISRKDVVSMSNFEGLQFIASFSFSLINFRKISVRNIWCKVIVIEIAVQ